MVILLFIVVLAILIIVHELGHFIVAKKIGARVDEFGIGFPPKIFSFKKGETNYSLNLIPLGGFVKIFGENPGEETNSDQDKNRSLIHKPKLAQAAVISAGVIFNLFFAWFLIFIGFMSGLPVSISEFKDKNITDSSVVVLEVLKDSPAEKIGLLPGDKILFIQNSQNFLQNFNAEEMQQFIASNEGQPIDLLYKRGKNEPVKATITPEKTTNKIGISMDTIGTVKLNIAEALWESLSLTVSLFVATISSLGIFIAGLITNKANLSQISGPVGIAGMFGSALDFGFIYLLSFTAFISINLAAINLIPFPALDGGRLVIIAIEGVIRRNIKPAFVNATNLIGFGLLILLMIIVTYQDIIKIF